jgi:hypothetical protein
MNSGWWLASDGQWYPPEPTSSPPESAPDGPPGRATVIGVAGASARRIASNWESGAQGEERTAAVLATMPSAFHVLHDLCVPGSKANIDHLVVGPAGVWLIDTKAYRPPLRYSGGSLWSGSHSLGEKTAAVAAYATKTRQVLGVPVTPVLCFVDNVVPPGAEVVAGVHCVSLDDLIQLVSVRRSTPIGDVASVVRLACTLRTPTPAPSTAPRRMAGGRRSGAPRPPTRAVAAPRPRGLGKKIVIGLVGLLALSIGLRLIPHAATAAGNTVSHLVVGTTTTPVTPPLNGPAIDVPTPAPELGVVCVIRGAGWEAGLVWPFTVDPAHAPAALDITVLAPAGAAIQPNLWLHTAPVPKAITGLAPNTTVVLSSTGILADGTRLRPTWAKAVTGPNPC